ncbi:pilus assembly PilX family protein [Algicola sagamiensis]|uniref:pilus assembly PilX family protein n=1 Tax=Algicola sagamiensis TaxID=163869 RepID=UPI000367E83C|nr:hypothetical protein [Algicola sagamiensis]
MRSYQRGFAIIFALVIMVSVTALGIALMSSSTLDSLVSRVAVDRMEAEHYAESAHSAALFENVNRKVQPTKNVFTLSLPDEELKPFAKMIGERVQATYDQKQKSTFQLTTRTENGLPTTCPHSNAASSVQQIQCVYLELKSTTKYGPFTNIHDIEIVTGISQEIKK